MQHAGCVSFAQNKHGNEDLSGEDMELKTQSTHVLDSVEYKIIILDTALHNDKNYFDGFHDNAVTGQHCYGSQTIYHMETDWRTLIISELIIEKHADYSTDGNHALVPRQFGRDV